MKADKEMKKVSGATMVIALKHEQACGVWGVRETQPVFWNLPQEGPKRNSMRPDSNVSFDVAARTVVMVAPT